MVRRRKRGVNFVGPVAHNRTFTDVSPFTAANARALVDEFGNVTLGPAGRLNDVAQLFWNDDGVIAVIDLIVTLVSAHFGAEGFENFLGLGGPLLHAPPRRWTRSHGYRRETPRNSP